MASSGLDLTIGALFIGVITSTFLQGLLTMQAYVYYDSFPSDPWHMKALVVFIWTSDLAHQIIVIYGAYYYAITSWGIPANLLFIPRAFSWHLFVIGLTTLACHIFFARRIWVLGKNMIVLGVLSTGIVAHFILEAFISGSLNKDLSVASYGNYTNTLIPMLVLGACLDTVMALMLMFYVHNGRSGMKRTNSIVNKIIQYTVATGFITSLLAFGVVISFLISSEGSFVYIAIHINLPRAYSNAFFATLNSRKRMREDMSSASVERPIQLSNLPSVAVRVRQDRVTQNEDGVLEESYDVYNADKNSGHTFNGKPGKEYVVHDDRMKSEV